MATGDPELDPVSTTLKPSRQPFLDPRYVLGQADPQMLRRSSKTLATSRLPELQQNLTAFGMAMPTSLTGAGQGIKFQLDPELNVRSSMIMPWLDRVDSPEFVDNVKRLRLDSERAAALMSGARARHSLETERMVRRIHSLVGAIDPDRIGYTIRMGLANPGVATSPATVRDAYVMASYLLSGAVVPEAASMQSMGRFAQERAGGRHAVRLAREAGLDDMGYVFGTSKAEHLKRLNLMTGGPEGRGFMMASLGLQQPRSAALPGEFFQEQILSGQKPVYTAFEQRLRDLVNEDMARVQRAKGGIARAGQSEALRSRIGLIYQDSMIDFVSDIFVDLPQGPAGPGLIQAPPRLDRDTIEKMIRTSFAEAATGWVGKVPDYNSLEHYDAVTRNLQDKLNHAVELVERKMPVPEDMKERVSRVSKEFRREFAKAVAAAQKGGELKVQALRNPSKATEALKSGRIAESRLAPLADEASKALAAMGRTMPKGGVPLLMVSALAAGLVATGMFREETA